MRRIAPSQDWQAATTFCWSATLNRRNGGQRAGRAARDSLKIEEVWVNVYHGGETPVPNEDIHLYLDNLVIARHSIGPLPARTVTEVGLP